MFCFNLLYQLLNIWAFDEYQNYEIRHFPPQQRLDRLAESGLDLMMTEFDIGWPDDLVRADWLEDCMRAFFGHPAMKGVILWGFWGEAMADPDHELVEGPDMNNIQVLFFND